MIRPLKVRLRHGIRFGTVLAVLSAAVCFVSPKDGSVLSAAPISKPIRGAHVRNELLVRFNPGVSPAEARAVLSRHGMTVMKSYKRVSNLHHVRLPSVLAVEAAIEILTAEPEVRYAEPDFLVEGDSACAAPCTPNDPEYLNQWGLLNIQAATAWQTTTGGGDSVVAILDTGIDYNHPDLSANAWINTNDPLDGIDNDGDGYPDDFHGYNAVADLGSGGLCPAPASSEPIDDDTSVHGHGTRLAGIIGAAGNNGIGVTGVNWDVKLMPIKIRCEPNRQGSLSLLLAGFDYLITKKTHGVNIRVANMSISVTSWSQALQDGIDAVRDAGVLLIGSAGNSTTNVDAISTDFHAHLYDNVLFVGAIDQTNALAGYSSYGQVGIHLAAPGTGILTTVRSIYNPMYSPDDGTSYSTPMVTGVAALLAASDPSLTTSELKARIMSATIQTNALQSKVAAGGRLNAGGIFNAPINDLLPMGYELARIRVGDKYYLDRTFTVTSIPQSLNGLWWVRTKNNDKTNTSPTYIQIGLGQSGSVYVAYDGRVSPANIPYWLRPDQGWADTGLSVGTNLNGKADSFHLYSRSFNPGTAVLGGPQAVGYNGPVGGMGTNYVVLVQLTGLAAPSNLNASDLPADNGGAIRLTWTPSASTTVSAQHLYRGTTGGGPYTMITSFADNTTNSYTDNGLTNGTTYYYVVRAYDGTQESGNSNEASAAPADNLAPAAPTALSAADNPLDNGGAIRLTWTPSTSADVVSQWIYRAAVSGGPYIVVANFADNSTNSYVDSGLTNGTAYYYIVRSFDGAQSSANSNEGSAIPEVNISNPPSVRVQAGTTTLGAGAVSITVPIASVDMAKAFLVFGTSFNDANPGYSQISGQITNSTTLTFRRASGTGSPAVVVKWYVAEFTGGVAVQRGTAFMTSTTVKAALSSVDLTKAVAIVSYRNSGGTYDANDFVKVKITSPTNLELSTNVVSSSGVVEWQVIEFAASQVQTGDLSFAAGDGVKTAGITGVDMAKSWLIYTYRTDNGTLANIGQKLVRGQITDPNTLSFDRSQTGQAIDLTWYVVEFTDGTTVQQGSQSFGTTETLKDIGIQAVDLTKSLAAGGYMAKGGRSAYATNDNPGVGWMRLDLTSGTNLRVGRGVTGSAAADTGWFVISFP